MKAIIISIKPKWCAKIMNGEKTIEVRKNKALANAIQKLIDRYGYADIYVYCTKEESLIYTDGYDGKGDYVNYKYYADYKGMEDDICSGKVVFKFRCYKVEEIGMWNYSEYGTRTLCEKHLCIKSCLDPWELKDYIKDKLGYAIHIRDLEMFDEPKELSEFRHRKQFMPSGYMIDPLTKAPQNFCYVEVE